MRLKKLPLYFLAAGFVLLITVGIFLLLPAQPVSAQCGSQASSCKNCHETQAKDPVNNDGTAWHTSHAFGDFCYLCHAGNNTATNETAAHTGMVDPLSDIAASCKSCHAADYQAKAQVYATTLGVTIGASAAAPTQAASQPSASSTLAAPAAPAAAPAAAIPAAAMVDYSQRYAEIVLGHLEPTDCLQLEIRELERRKPYACDGPRRHALRWRLLRAAPGGLGECFLPGCQADPGNQSGAGRLPGRCGRNGSGTGQIKAGCTQESAPDPGEARDSRRALCLDREIDQAG